MRSPICGGLLFLSSLLAGLAASSPSSSPTSNVIQPSNFTPPRAFKNTNLLRNIDLSRPYVRESTGVIVENISGEDQTEYYVAVDRELFDKVSYVEARDKKGGIEGFEVSKVDFNSKSPVQYYRILFSKPLPKKEQMTMEIKIGYLDILVPVPAEVAQNDKQYLQWTGTNYCPSAYVTLKQKTKVKVHNTDAPDYTKLSPKSDGTADPTKVGATFTYGPYDNVDPKKSHPTPISIRYEYTAPVITMNKLQRHIEVSHWGGNLAVEEKYSMTNNGAKLKGQFSRVSWAQKAYYNSPTHAIKSLTFNLEPGALDPYYTDEIGNISTSRFRSNMREARLELMPRFPIFGGWNSSFTVGWNHDLGNFLKTKASGEDYVLKLPFLEGPGEPTVYKQVEVTVVLPEGASNVQYISPVPIEKEERYLHKTFMDTLGRTTLKLSLSNVADEQQHREFIVTYRLPRFSGVRKPFVIFTAISTVFMLSWLVSKIDMRIGK